MNSSKKFIINIGNDSYSRSIFKNFEKRESQILSFIWNNKRVEILSEGYNNIHKCSSVRCLYVGDIYYNGDYNNKITEPELVSLYELYGEECFRMLNGYFAGVVFINNEVCVFNSKTSGPSIYYLYDPNMDAYVFQQN